MNLLVDVVFRGLARNEVDLALFLGSGDFLVIGFPGRQPGTMAEKMTNRHPVLAEVAKGRTKASDVIIEPKLVFTYQQHNSDRGRQWLGQRSKIKDGARLHHVFRRDQRTPPESLLVDDLVF